MISRRLLGIAVLAWLIMLTSAAGWAQTSIEDSLQMWWEQYNELLPPPAESVPQVLEMTTPLLLGPMGLITVRAMPGSRDLITGNEQPYAWPGRNFPIWGNVTGNAGPWIYVWDFGDGSPNAVGAVTNPNYIYVYHSYSTVGFYEARLTVTDSDGASASATAHINVAAVSEQVRTNAAIEDGLRYLYLRQGTDGRWNSNYPTTSTAAAVAAYEIRGHFPTNDSVADIYAERVQLGLNYIFPRLVTQAIGVQPHGNPDLNGNGLGVRFNEGYGAYSQGIIMFAIANSRAPNSIVLSGPAGIIGRTYKDILTDMVDQLSWSQYDSDNSHRGGWRYSVSVAQYDSDNSAVQWASIALAAAEDFPWSITAPQFVKDELMIWTNYSRCVLTGGFGYQLSCPANVGRTGSGIYSLYYLGVDKSDPRVVAGLNFLCNQWFNTTSYDGQFCGGNFYALYAVKKALEDYEVTTEVCNHAWKAEFARHLVRGLTSPSVCNSYHQVTDTNDPINDGRWNNDAGYVSSYGGDHFSTAFALLILTPGVTACTPVAVISVDPPAVCPGTQICFDGSASYIPPCQGSFEIVQWRWDLDNNGDFERSGQTVCLPGGFPLPSGETQHDYTVRLQVVSNEGKSGTGSAVVHIGDANHNPIAVCGGPYTACVGEPITLNGCLSYDPDSACLSDGIVEYCWDFEPDGVWDLCTTECAPNTALVFNGEVYKYIQLRVRDRFGLVSASNGGLVEVWSSRKELSVTADDVIFGNAPGCASTEICATIHAATQDPGIEIESAVVDFYYDDPADPSKRLGRFNTPVMQNGDTVTFCVSWAPPLEGHSIYVVVDPNQLIRECVETDNVAVKVWNCPSEECEEQPILSLVGYRTVNYAAPLWQVQVEVRNAGPGQVQNVNVVMNEEIDWLTIPDPNCGYSEILEGGTSWGDDTYTFDLTNHPGGSFNVWFDVTYEDSCGNPYHVRLDPEFDPGKTAQTAPALSFRLAQNYPNPFNPNTTISYQIPVRSMVNLSVFDVSGRLIRTLVNEYNEPGLYAAQWDGKDSRSISVASGVYFSKLQAGSYKETKRMVLLR